MALKPIFQQLFGGGGAGVSNPTVGANKTTTSGTGVKPSSTVTVYKNGAQAGTATANAQGAWSYTFGAPLQPGDVVTYDAVLTSPAYTVPTQITLGALTLSPSSATTGTSYSGTVSGQTAGSTLSLTGAGAAGLSISGSTITGTPTTAGPVNVVETLSGATNSPRTSTGVLTVAAAPVQPTLGTLTLSLTSATVGAAYSGTISGKTSGSTITLSGAGAAGLSVSGSTVSGTPTATGAVNLIETLSGATNTPNTTSNALIVGNAAVTLAALTLSSTAATAGSAFSATISGKTSGSTISATSSDGTALTVSGTTLSGTFSTAGTPTVTLTETLAGATNTPRTSTASVTVSASVSVPAAPTITLTGGNGQVSVAWTDGATNGAAITSHKLYRGTVSGSRTLVGTISTASPYVDTGLTNGTAYFYSLSAVNSAGEGPQSAQASATPNLSLASGAVGLWWMDQTTTAGVIPNAQAATPYSGNVLRAPRRLFSSSSYWNFSNVAVSNDGTTAISISGANNDASTFTPSTAAWFMYLRAGDSLPAGTYTLMITGAATTGTVAINYNTSFSASQRNPVGTFTTTPSRIFVTFTMASAWAMNNLIILGDGTNTSPFAMMDVELIPGTLTPSSNATNPLGGHITLGTSSADTRTAGKYAAGELDMSTNGAFGLAQFSTSAITNAFTAQALVKKIIARSTIEAFLSKAQSFSQWSATMENNGQPYFSNFSQPQSNGATAPALWNRLSYGLYHVISHRFDGTTYSLWLDDICVATRTGSNALSGGLNDLYFSSVQGSNNTTGDKYAGGMVLYSSALSDADLQNNVLVLMARANAQGVTAAPTSRWIVVYGDSRSAGSLGSRCQWASLLSANLSPYTMGIVRAANGAYLNAGTNNGNNVQDYVTAMPAIPARSGRKVIGIVGMMGANDLGPMTGTDAAAASNYYSTMGSVFDALTAKGITHRALLTENPIAPASQYGTPHNTRRNLLNPKYRAAFPGSNPGSLADLDTDVHWQDDNSNTDYPTYWDDQLHQSATVGDPAIEVIARPVINAILAGQ